MEKETLEVFTRYTKWIKDNNLDDTIYTYMFYFEYIEKVDFYLEVSNYDKLKKNNYNTNV